MPAPVRHEPAGLEIAIRHHPTGRPIPYRHVVSSDGRSTADEIARLADLRDRGVISEEEFQQATAKAIS